MIGMRRVQREERAGGWWESDETHVHAYTLTCRSIHLSIHYAAETAAAKKEEERALLEAARQVRMWFAYVWVIWINVMDTHPPICLPPYLPTLPTYLPNISYIPTGAAKAAGGAGGKAAGAAGGAAGRGAGGAGAVGGGSGVRVGELGEGTCVCLSVCVLWV